MKLPSVLYFRCLVAVVPPGFRNAATVVRFCRGPSEDVPIRDPVRRLVPVRHPVATGAKYAIERLAGNDEFGSGGGRDDAFDQRVDHGVRNTGEILRTLGGGGLRGEKRPQSIARS